MLVSYKQRYDNSCGAAALMCAACELGNVVLLPHPLITNPIWTPPAVPYTIPPLGNQTAETLIYAVTSNSPGPPSNQSGYSLPSRIGLVANSLRLAATSYVPRSILGALLLYLYNTEEPDAAYVGMPLIRTEAPMLTENQRLLKILRVGDAQGWVPATGLHYVMQRPRTDDAPEGSIMDPALGQNFPSLEIAINAHHADGTLYQDTGLSVLISSP